MEKKKVADVLKEIIPAAVDIISDKLSKDDNNGVKMECNFEKVDKPGMKPGTVKTVTLYPGDTVITNDNGECEVIKKADDKQLVNLVVDDNGVLSIDNDQAYIDDVNSVNNLAVGLIKYKPINKIVENMNERGLSDIEKVKESYNNGFVDGFMMANCAQQYHIDHAYEKLSDLNEIVETSKMIIDQKFK